MSENSSKIGKYQFVAEPFHVDFTGRLTMGVLDVYKRQGVLLATNNLSKW